MRNSSKALLLEMSMKSQANQYRLLYNETHSDLTVTCKDATWHLHKDILSQRCPFFRTISNGHFIEGEYGIVKLDDDNPEALERMLQYIYAKIMPEPHTFEASSTAMQQLTELYIIADKYCLTGLRDCAKHCFKNIPKPRGREMSEKEEEDTIRMMVHYEFGLRTTDVFGDEIKLYIGQRVYWLLVRRDWFDPVAKELADSFPALGELLLLEGVRLAKMYVRQIAARDDRTDEQDEIIEDLEYPLVVARRGRNDGERR
jgi:hypothetical protein